MKSIIFDTPICPIRISEDKGRITEISENLSNNACCNESALLLTAKEQILDYLEGRRRVFNFPIRFSGTSFQMAVWEQCRKIGYGHVGTYSEIAEAIGHPKAVRAVGTALKNNPLLFVIPCHRIKAKNGDGGFRLGSATKRQLLELESKNLGSP